MKKKDQLKSLIGREITYIVSEKVKIKCFVAGIDKNAISLHAIDFNAYLKTLAKHNRISLKVAREQTRHPYDYVFCVNKKDTGNKQEMDNRYEILLAILLSDKKSFKYEDVVGTLGFSSGHATCPF